MHRAAKGDKLLAQQAARAAGRKKAFPTRLHRAAKGDKLLAQQAARAAGREITLSSLIAHTDADERCHNWQHGFRHAS